MIEVDLLADIVPGKSAAGFSIGDSLSFRDFSPPPLPWNSEALKLREALARSPKWLIVDDMQLGADLAIAGINYYFGYGAVRLHSDRSGRIDWIALKKGYLGTLYGAIRVGDRLKTVCEFFDIVYDDDIQLHVPANSAQLSGVAFQAEETSLYLSPNQVITTIIID